MTTRDSTVSQPWMDKKSLEQWLRPHYGEITVADLDVKAASGAGDNFLSEMHRLTIMIKNGDSISLIVKCRLEGNSMYESIFKAEQEVYESALPKINSLLEKVATDTFVPFTPKCIYSSRNFLILEDLSASEYKMMDRYTGVDLNNSVLVMHTLAKFHAASVILHEMDPNYMYRFAESAFLDPSADEDNQKFNEGLIKNIIQEIEKWPKEWAKYTEKLRPLQKTMWDHLKKMARRDSSTFNVLAHGDLWINNIMFCEQKESIKFIDFQGACFMSPAMDLQYFIVTSLKMDVREDHIDKLLQEYHTTLCDTLTALGYTKPPITLRELHNEFHKKAMFGVYSLLIALPMMLSKPGDFSYDEAMKGIAQGSRIYNDDYKKIVKLLLPEYDRRGLFKESTEKQEKPVSSSLCSTIWQNCICFRLCSSSKEYKL